MHMTKEQFKQKLKEHNFSSYGEFLDFVEENQRMSQADKYSMLREEYDAEHNKPIKKRVMS